MSEPGTTPNSESSPGELLQTIEAMDPNKLASWLKHQTIWRNIVDDEDLELLKDAHINGSRFFSTTKDGCFENLFFDKNKYEVGKLQTTIRLLAQLGDKLHKSTPPQMEAVERPEARPTHVARSRSRSQEPAHWSYYKSGLEAARAAPSEVAAYCNPGSQLGLPFLSPTGLENRVVEIEGRPSLKYFGRANFSKLYTHTMGLKSTEISCLSLRGTVGAGKSHLLAAIACFMVSNGHRVVFVADCSPLMKTPITCLKEALCFAFGDDSEILESVSRVKTAEDLTEICHSLAEKSSVYFIFDQFEAVDNVVPPQRTVSVEQEQSRSSTRKLLEGITKGHLVIVCNSAADFTTPDPEALQMFVHCGLTKIEMFNWWRASHGGQKWTPYMREAERLELEEYIGGIPTLLAVVASWTPAKFRLPGNPPARTSAELSRTTLGLLIGELHSSRVVRVWNDTLYKVAWARMETCGSDDEKKSLIRMYSACLSEAAVLENWRHFTDHRFFYTEDNISKASCGLVKDLTKNFLWAQHKWHRSEFIELRWEGATHAHSSIKRKSLHDNLVLEFMLKNTVLAWLHNQGNRALRIERCDPTFFTGVSPTFTNHTNIYIPQTWHPLIDAIYVRINKTGPVIVQGIRSALKIPENFGEIETLFVQLAEEWATRMNWRVVIEFAWILRTRERLLGFLKIEDRTRTQYTRRVSTMKQINSRMGKSLSQSAPSARWDAYQTAIGYEEDERMRAKRRAEQEEEKRKRREAHEARLKEVQQRRQEKEEEKRKMAEEHEARLKEVQRGRQEKEEEKRKRREAHEANMKRQAREKTEKRRLQQEFHERRFSDRPQLKTELVSPGVGDGGSQTARKTASNWNSTANHNAKRRRTEVGRYM